MKRILYITIAACTVLILGSCTKEITADLENKSGNPVLNGFLRPDTFVRVELTRSNPVLTGNGTPAWLAQDFDSIPDATVLVYDNGMAHTLVYDASQDAYVGDFVPQEGHTYRTVCQFPGVDKEVSSEPQTVGSAKSLATFSLDSAMINGAQHFLLEFSLNDDPTTDDYYHILLTHQCYMGGELVASVPVQIDNDLQDPTGASGTGLFSNVAYSEVYAYSGILFNDKDADGKTIQFRLPLLAIEFGCDGGERKLHAEVRKCSKAYYEYMTSITDYFNYSSGGSPFSTPVQIYNNINNGIGIWATYTATEASITQ